MATCPILRQAFVDPWFSNNIDERTLLNNVLTALTSAWTRIVCRYYSCALGLRLVFGWCSCSPRTCSRHMSPSWGRSCTKSGCSCSRSSCWQVCRRTRTWWPWWRWWCWWPSPKNKGGEMKGEQRSRAHSPQQQLWDLEVWAACPCCRCTSVSASFCSHFLDQT